MAQLNCKYCKGSFRQWTYTWECYNCDEGMAECTRDIDFDTSGYCKCHVCNGSGELSRTETIFCCEECIESHENGNV